MWMISSFWIVVRNYWKVLERVYVLVNSSLSLLMNQVVERLLPFCVSPDYETDLLLVYCAVVDA